MKYKKGDTVIAKKSTTRHGGLTAGRMYRIERGPGEWTEQSILVKANNGSSFWHGKKMFKLHNNVWQGETDEIRRHSKAIK